MVVKENTNSSKFYVADFLHYFNCSVSLAEIFTEKSTRFFDLNFLSIILFVKETGPYQKLHRKMANSV